MKKVTILLRTTTHRSPSYDFFRQDRALRKQLVAVFSDRASRRVGKNSIDFTEKDQ